MFEYCRIIDKNCPTNGRYKGQLYCGMAHGSLEENLISNLKECPKKVKRR